MRALDAAIAGNGHLAAAFQAHQESALAAYRRARGRVLELELRVGVVEHGKRGVRDLVADAVARENQYLQCWNLKIAAKTPRAPRNATTVFIGD